MKYVVKNHKNVFIRLSENGKPVTCTEKNKGVFEYSKARNILDNLPKTLKKLRFKVEAVSDIMPKKNDMQDDRTYTQNSNYVVPDNVIQWVDKFGICDDIIKEAKLRKEELIRLLSNFDRAISNWMHDVELEKRKNASAGYNKYRDVKDLVDKRRAVKDELLIVSDILAMDFRRFDRDILEKAVLGLTKRKFKYRVVEEDETESVV